MVHTDPAKVAEAAAALHRPVHVEDGLADLLHLAVNVAIQWLPDVDFAGIAMQFDRTPFTAVGTDPRVLAMDELQAVLGDGPGPYAWRTAHIVSVTAA